MASYRAILQLNHIQRQRKSLCQTSIGRPLKLALIVNYQAFRDDGYFIDPILFTMQQLKTLEKSDNMRKRVMFKALVSTMLNGGEIKKTHLEEALDRALLVDFMEREDRQETIQGCIQQLINVYIKETTDKTSYKIMYEVITKCIFLAAVENNSELLFTECHHFPLFECIRHKLTLEKIMFPSQIVVDEERLQIGIPTYLYPMIAKIIVERNVPMDMLGILQFFENKEFQAEWLKQKMTASRNKSF